MKDCKHCKDRQPACQDSCERFLTAKKRETARKEKIRAAKERDVLVTNTAIKLSEMRRRRYAK